MIDLEQRSELVQICSRADILCKQVLMIEIKTITIPASRIQITFHFKYYFNHNLLCVLPRRSRDRRREKFLEIFKHYDDFQRSFKNQRKVEKLIASF